MRTVPLNPLSIKANICKPVRCKQCNWIVCTEIRQHTTTVDVDVKSNWKYSRYYCTLNCPDVIELMSYFYTILHMQQPAASTNNKYIACMWYIQQDTQLGNIGSTQLDTIQIIQSSSRKSRNIAVVVWTNEKWPFRGYLTVKRNDTYSQCILHIIFPCSTITVQFRQHAATTAETSPSTVHTKYKTV